MTLILQRSISLLQRSMSWLVGRLRRAHRHQVSPQAGFALLVVMSTVAVLGAVVGEFGYNARVELEAAANARDTLRAEYLARSGISLSRLLIKVQTKVIDGMINPMAKGDFQITQFAPYLLAAFGGGEEERKGMGALLGFDTSAMKGLGVGKGGSFDALLGTEDGKINLNCAGGFGGAASQPPPANPAGSSGAPPPPQNNGPQLGTSNASLLYNMLSFTMFPARYNRMFESVKPDGQYYTRDDIARAIIDWTDIDEQRFDPVTAATGTSSSGNNEDYKYDTLRDPFKARNNFLDTVEEVNLVRGVDDELWGDFGGMFTAYGRCQINFRAISSDNWPITAAILRASAADQNDPVLLDDTIVAAQSQRLATLMSLPGLVTDLNAVQNGVNDPTKLIPANSLVDPNLINTLPGGSGLPPLKIDAGKLNRLARMNVPREIYRIESTGLVKRGGDKKIQVRVRAIWDTQKYNQNTTSPDANDRLGTWVYWRME